MERVIKASKKGRSGVCTGMATWCRGVFLTRPHPSAGKPLAKNLSTDIIYYYHSLLLQPPYMSVPGYRLEASRSVDKLHDNTSKL